MTDDVLRTPHKIGLQLSLVRLQPESLTHCAADFGIEGVALLDRDTVSGAVRFHIEAKGRGVKPIIGAEITMEDGSLLPLVPMDLRAIKTSHS